MTERYRTFVFLDANVSLDTDSFQKTFIRAYIGTVLQLNTKHCLCYNLVMWSH